MPHFARIIIFFWLVFVVIWLVSARWAKRRVRGRSWAAGALFRAAVIVGVFQLHRFPVFHEVSRKLGLGAVNPVIGLTGVALCGAGIALAVWARLYLGRNWGMPMSLQEGHELVTTGPYARIRHPIYTGILLAMLGSALAVGAAWFIPFLIFTVYFVYSAKVEEKLMRQQFPDQYPAYMEKTKMLVPFVW